MMFLILQTVDDKELISLKGSYYNKKREGFVSKKFSPLAHPHGDIFNAYLIELFDRLNCVKQNQSIGKLRRIASQIVQRLSSFISFSTFLGLQVHIHSSGICCGHPMSQVYRVSRSSNSSDSHRQFRMWYLSMRARRLHCGTRDSCRWVS